MDKHRKFRAAQRIRQAGVVGVMLMLLAGELPAQTGPSSPPPGPAVYLKFFNADWTTILNQVAEQSGSVLVMHEVPPGHFTMREKTPYSRHEAVQILNRELEPEGFRILEKDRFLIVMHQRALRTRYRQPDRPTQPEWEAKPAGEPQFEESRRPKRSVTPIATKETQSPAPIQLAENTQPIPPAALETAAWSTARLTPQNNVRDLAGMLYKALKPQAELVDAGVSGLPAFRVKLSSATPSAAPQGYEVGIDLAKNEVVMAGSPERLEKLTKLFQYLDRETNAFQQPIQLIAADENTAHLTQELMPNLKRIVREAEKTKARPAPRVVSENAVSDLEREWALAQAQPNLNQPQQPPANAQPQPMPGTQVVPVQPQDSSAGIQAIIANFRGDVQIQAVPELGIMILRGNQADVDALVKIIQQIQTQTAGMAPQIHLLLLEHVNSETLAELLRSVYEQLGIISTRTGQPRQQVSFIPIARPNAVMILAPKVQLDSIIDLAVKLDQPLDPETDTQVFHLKHAIASQAATALQNTFQAAAAPTGTGAAAATPAALQPRIQVVPDIRTNSLIVQARPNDMKQVVLILSEIDSPGPGAVNKMRVVPLKNAVADELANVITSTIQGLLNPPTVTGQPPQGQVQQQQFGQAGQGPQELRDVKAVALEFLSEVGGLEKTVRSGILADIRVTPDIRSNSLIVSAPEVSMDMMLALIQQLDQPTSTVAEIKVFALENADAASMIELLTTLFEPADDANQPGVQIVGAEDASSGLIPLRFSVDIRTNSIIAIGGGDALRVVEAILLRLDESDVRQRQTTVVKLRNSPATEIAAAINLFLQSQRDLAAIDPELVSNIELLEREIIAVAEPVSNSLLISATPRYYEEIQRLIQKLDEEPPQVVIQALLVEVALDNTDEFGVELGFQDDILFDRSTTLAENLLTISQTNTSPNGVQTTTQQIVSQATTPGFRFTDPGLGLGQNVSAAPELVGGQSISNFSLGRLNNELGFGGLVLSASSNEVSLLLRALAARRQVHILSRPQIRTLDNQVAQIQVGQQVPIVTGFTPPTATVGAYPLVTQDSAGIILTVTPRISPEENIVMEVVAEKSAFTGAGVPLFVDPTTGNTIESPIKDITTARTTVGVPNGQTIVLGGMISKNDETLERKVPWLGDVPYLGLPFRYDSTRTRRTELLIFLTPRIIRGDADSELIKQVESERMHFIQEEVEEIHGPLYSIPGPLGYPGWMDGFEDCPPGTEVLPGMEGTLPYERNTVPTPPPAVPPGAPYSPPAPANGHAEPMSGKLDDPGVPTSIVPAGGFRQTSSSVEQTGGTRPPAKKRSWFSLGSR